MKITLTDQEFQDLIDGYVETGKEVLKRSGFLPDFELMPKLDKDIEEAFSSFAQESFVKLIERQKKIGTGILSILEITDPNAAIAGGAARDWYLGRPASDIDFFFYLAIDPNEEFNIDEEKQKCLEFVSNQFPFLRDLHLLETQYNNHRDIIVNPPTTNDTTYEKFYVVEGTYVDDSDNFEQKLQFIVSNKEIASEVTKNFPVSISQIYYNYGEYHKTEFFEWTLKNKCILLTRDGYDAGDQKYIQKIRNKFSGFDFLSLDFSNAIADSLNKDKEATQTLWKVVKEMSYIEEAYKECKEFSKKNKVLKRKSPKPVKNEVPF